jgi:N-hydroxyarylamine O-acetyltransferase
VAQLQGVDQPLVAEADVAQPRTATVGGWTWRVERETGPQGAPGPWVLRSLHEDGWFDLYAFTPETHYPVDFEVSNYYTAHSARSTFTGKLIAMHGTEKVRSTLKNGELTRAYPDGRADVAALSGTEMIQALREVFGVSVTDDDAHLLRQRYAPS